MQACMPPALLPRFAKCRGAQEAGSLLLTAGSEGFGAQDLSIASAGY